MAPVAEAPATWNTAPLIPELATEAPAVEAPIQQDFAVLDAAAELEQQLQAPAAPADPLARRKANADNTTVVLVTGVFPIKRKDGTIVAGGYDVRAKQSASVNFGTGDMPNYRRVDVQETYFTIWDDSRGGNDLGSQMFELFEDAGTPVVRLYWDFSASADNVCVKQITKVNGEVIDREVFRYAPKKRIWCFEHLNGGTAPRQQELGEDFIPF